MLRCRAVCRAGFLILLLGLTSVVTEGAVSFLSPTPGEILLGEVVFKFAVEGGHTPVDKIDVYVAGKLVGSATGPAWTLTWNAPETIIGTRVTAVAYAGGKPLERVELPTQSLGFSQDLTVAAIQLFPVVRDRKSRYVGGLKREDFELLDQGKVVSIETFATDRLRPTALGQPLRRQGGPRDQHQGAGVPHRLSGAGQGWRASAGGFGSRADAADAVELSDRASASHGVVAERRRGGALKTKALDLYRKTLEKETNGVLRESMVFNLYLLRDSFSTEERKIVDTLYKEIAPTTPPYDKWFSGTDNTLRMQWWFGTGDKEMDDFLKAGTDAMVSYHDFVIKTDESGHRVLDLPPR